MSIDINSLTLGQIREIADMAQKMGLLNTGDILAVRAADRSHEKMAVIVCTDKRGVFFGYTTNHEARPIVLTEARMAIYWSSDVGGVNGLSEIGPTTGCKISAAAPSITLEGVTAIYGVNEKAIKAWKAAPVQGR